MIRSQIRLFIIIVRKNITDSVCQTSVWCQFEVQLNILAKSSPKKYIPIQLNYIQIYVLKETFFPPNFNL